MFKVITIQDNNKEVQECYDLDDALCLYRFESIDCDNVQLFDDNKRVL